MFRFYAITVVLLWGSSAWAGDIQGRAVVTKRLTKKVLSPITYNLRGAAPAPLKADDEPSNEFNRLVIFLEGGPKTSKAPETVVIDQRNTRFVPDLVVVPVGSTVEFPNSDPIFHNIFSLSKTQPFDLGFYPQGQTRTVKLNREGIVQVYCHIHSNMYAAIVVTSSEWFTRPAEDGSFSWSNVPAGHYKLIAWHKIAGYFRTTVDVPETGSVEATIHIPLAVESQR